MWFFSVAWITTYNVRLSVWGGGGRDRSTSICVGKERDLAMYRGRSIDIHGYV